MAKYISSDGINKEVDLLKFRFLPYDAGGDNEVGLRCYSRMYEPIDLKDVFDDVFLRKEDVYHYFYLGYTEDETGIKAFNHLQYCCNFAYEDINFSVELTQEEKTMFAELLNATPFLNNGSKSMEKAYVYNDGKGDTVIIANSEADARKLLGNDNAEFIVEPVKAYNIPVDEIVVATSINSIKTNKKTNMKYWDGVDAVIEKHVAECIEELKQWSTKDIVLESNAVSKEDVIMEISKSVGEVLVDRLEEFCGAEFPYCQDELQIDNGSQKVSLDKKMETAERKNSVKAKETVSKER